MFHFTSIARALGSGPALTATIHSSPVKEKGLKNRPIKSPRLEHNKIIRV